MRRVYSAALLRRARVQGVGGRDQDRDRGRDLDVLVMGGDRVDDFPILAAAGRHLRPDLRVGPLPLVIDRLADIVKHQAEIKQLDLLGFRFLP